MYLRPVSGYTRRFYQKQSRKKKKGKKKEGGGDPQIGKGGKKERR